MKNRGKGKEDEGERRRGGKKTRGKEGEDTRWVTKKKGKRFRDGEGKGRKGREVGEEENREGTEEE